MPFVFKRLALLLSIAAAFAADKQPSPFKPGSADSFASHQTNAKITMGVDPYVMGDKIRVAFGKVNPYQYGVLPVLVVIQNDSDVAIKLDGLHAEYVGPNGDRVDATPAHDVRYAVAPRRPGVINGPVGAGAKILGKKNPLDEWEIEGRALSAQMLPPGQGASGFLYFETGLQRGATIYIRGMREASSGKELLFFELPLSSDSPEATTKK
jgi:hypothetical protein